MQLDDRGDHTQAKPQADASKCCLWMIKSGHFRNVRHVSALPQSKISQRWPNAPSILRRKLDRPAAGGVPSLPVFFVATYTLLRSPRASHREYAAQN
jgi:hypothetical protein